MENYVSKQRKFNIQKCQLDKKQFMALKCNFNQNINGIFRNVTKLLNFL